MVAYHTKSNKCNKNPLITFSCEVAKVFQKCLKTTGLSLPSCPLWNNPSFMAGTNPLTNNIWQCKKLTCLGQVIRDGKIIPFQELKTEFMLDYTRIFQYFQIRSILQSHSFENMNELLDSQLKSLSNSRRTVSKLYKMLCPNFFDCCKSILDQSESLTTDQWAAILKRSNNVSKCVTYKIIQFKILHRLYITPDKLRKMNSNVSNLCWRSCGKSGTLIHLLWSCPEVKTFWAFVEEFICKLFKMNRKLSPLVCLQGNKVKEVKSNEL